jgi:hypothetical protein
MQTIGPHDMLSVRGMRGEAVGQEAGSCRTCNRSTEAARVQSVVHVLDQDRDACERSTTEQSRGAGRQAAVRGEVETALRESMEQEERLDRPPEVQKLLSHSGVLFMMRYLQVNSRIESMKRSESMIVIISSSSSMKFWSSSSTLVNTQFSQEKSQKFLTRQNFSNV